MENLTDEEIIRAFKLCLTGASCSTCPYYRCHCTNLNQDMIEVVGRLKKQLRALKVENYNLRLKCGKTK